MPNLPTLALVDRCPEPDCQARIGEKHLIDCHTAICVMTGQQRILHAADPPPPVTIAAWCAGVVPVDLDVHICGEDVWTGRPHGAVEAAANGLFVRPATTDDAPQTGWLPCQPGEPGAAPDLNRLVRTGTWNPIRQVWELPAEVAGGDNPCVMTD